MEDFISIYTRAIPKALCQEIIDQYLNDQRKSLLLPTEGIDYRKCKSLLISELTGWEILEKKIKDIFDEQARDYAQKFIYATPVEYEYEGLTIAGYENSSEYAETHYDSGKTFTNRIISAVAYLNDVHVGGEIVFPNQDKSISPVCGNIILFPPNFTHIHYVNPPENSARYVAITWYSWVTK